MKARTPPTLPAWSGTTAWLAAGLGLVLGTLSSSVAPADERESELRRLVEQVARGDDVEAEAAAEQLIELITGPLAKAIGPLEKRTVEEQLRLRRVMARVAGALRVRVFRTDLPPEDRKLFDTFAAAYPDLVQRLFDDLYAVRMAAVLQVPLEPNSGAGVVIAAKVNDEDEDVAVAALRAAAQLHDAVVARNLTRYIRDATAAIAAGFYGPEQQDIARTVALFVWESGKIVGSAGATESVPTLCEALRFFGQSPYWDHYRRAGLIQVLGELGDRQATSLLLEFLDDGATLRWHATKDNKHVTRTVGDVALQSLLRLYELNPSDFGMLTPLAGGQFAGYADEEARREGHRAFRIWHEQHARSQLTQTCPSASQPAREKD